MWGGKLFIPLQRLSSATLISTCNWHSFSAFSRIRAKGPFYVSFMTTRLFPFFYLSFLIFCCAMTFWKWYCAFHRNPKVVCAASGYFYALNHLCDVKVPRMWCQFCWQEKRGSSEMAVRAFVWILSCFHGVHQCNTLQTRLSLHDLCAALVLQCPNLVRGPLSFPFPPRKQSIQFSYIQACQTTYCWLVRKERSQTNFCM